MNNKKMYYSYQNQVIEFSFNSQVKYKDPFNDINLDVVFSEPNGNEQNVPAFWAGENIWRVRHTSHIKGVHKFLTNCSNHSDSGLDNQSGFIDIKEFEGKNELLKHGRIKVTRDNSYLEHMDGTPFLWLGDTWWFAFTKRFRWPEIFKIMTEDRVRKGFSVVQINTGFNPDFGREFNELEANEAGYVWDKDFKSINPYYFDMADLKIMWLIESGLMPCIFGAWGYYLPWLGIEKMKKHWRYIIARWGAYPVVWCVAGEARMPHYSFTDPSERTQLIKEQSEGWLQVAKYIREIDPFNNLLTVHPSGGDLSYSSRDIFSDQSLFDIDMLQTGHSDTEAFEDTLKTLEKSLSAKIKKPVINGEVCYEGILGSNFHNTQRFLFWTHMLSGAAGHTYGAEGIWEFRSEENYKGMTGNWGTIHWQEAIDFPGSFQLGIAKKFLEKFSWYKFKPNNEWVVPHCTENNRFLPYCAGIENKVRIIYMPALYLQSDFFVLNKIKIKSIEKNSNYKAYFFDPRSGTIIEIKDFNPDKNGEWTLTGFITPNPTPEDWVLVLENKN